MNLAQGIFIALAKIGDRLVDRTQPSHQPDDFKVALAFPNQSTAATHPIDVTIHPRTNNAADGKAGCPADVKPLT
jgi:hypothetical protein